MASFSFPDFNGRTMQVVNKEIRAWTLVKPFGSSGTASTGYEPDKNSIISANDNTVYLIGMDASGDTYAANATWLANSFISDLVLSGNLTVKGNTILGDASTDTITLNGKVIGSISAAEANETINTLTANTINVSTLNIKNAAGSYVPYRPFFPSNAAPTNRNIFWLDTTNSAVPIIKYCTNPDMGDSTAVWVSLGAVFG